MRIDTINYNPNTDMVRIGTRHREHDGKDSVEAVHKSKDVPHPDFISALRACKPVVEEISMLPAGFVDEVRGFSLYRDPDDEEEWTAIFTATKKVKSTNSPLVINTPKAAPDEDMRECVQDVIAEAKAYIQGKRAQGELVDNNKTESEPRKKSAAKKAAKKSSKKRAAKKKAAAKKGPRLLDEGESNQKAEAVADTDTRPEAPASPYPKVPADDDSAQVYEATGPRGQKCKVKCHADGWYGRVSGRPVALQQKTSATAMALIEKSFKKQLEWRPTIDLDGTLTEDDL